MRLPFGGPPRLERFSPTLTHPPLMPAKAGIQFLAKALGPRFRGHERRKHELIQLMR